MFVPASYSEAVVLTSISDVSIMEVKVDKNTDNSFSIRFSSINNSRNSINGIKYGINLQDKKGKYKNNLLLVQSKKVQ